MQDQLKENTPKEAESKKEDYLDVTPIQNRDSKGVINTAFGYFVKLLKETILWFFKGLASCSAQVLGFLMVCTAIVSVIVGLSGGSSSFDTSQSITGQSDEVLRDYGGDDKIAYVELDGIILENNATTEPFGGGLGVITPDRVEGIFNHIRRDEKVKAVLLYVTSPGGSPVASDRIYEIIFDFKKDTKVPVVVLMGDVAASGGYYISAAADKIVAHKSTITGSIGVIFETYNLKGLYEKVGVKKEVFKAGKYKDILSDNRDMTQEEKDLINNLMQDAYDSFIDRVVEGRKMSLEDVKQKAEGKIYSGKSAKEAGLIDQIGTLNDAIALSAKLSDLEKYKVVKVKGTSIWDDIFFGLNTGFSKLGINLGIVHYPSYSVLYKLP